MSVRDVLVAAAADLAGAEATESASGSVEWSAGGVAFASLGADGTAEFRLAPMIARAALGTPDTAASPRGAGWVAFRPRELDRFATDRAVAWIGSAHRHALAGGTDSAG